MTKYVVEAAESSRHCVIAISGVRMLRLAMVPAALVSLVAPSLLLAPAATAASGPVCTDGHCIVTYGYTGGPESFTVPSGVTVVSATVSGASGGLGDGRSQFVAGAGGRGGTVTATVPVSAGDQLRIVVGQQGRQGVYGSGGPVVNGGYGGGGLGVYDGSGGGASYLSRGTSLLVVAGGGGGGGSSVLGSAAAPGGDGGAGTNGHAGSPAVFGGPAGTTTGPGGSVDCSGSRSGVGTGPAAPPATFGMGGSGDDCGTNGGGGGYYGGSSGGYDETAEIDGGAGGGSGFLGPSVTGVAGTPNAGNGAIAIAYDLPKTATATGLKITPSSVPAGGHTTLTAAVTSGTGVPTGTVTFVDKTHNRTLGTATLVSGAASFVLPVGDTAGTRIIVATYGGSGVYGASTSQTVTLKVTAAPATPGSTPTPNTTPTSTTTAPAPEAVPVAAPAAPVVGRASFTG
jgi:hypothetical protein